MFIIRKDLLHSTGFILCILYLSIINCCSTFKLIKYQHHPHQHGDLPRTHILSLPPLQKRFELFEPLDTNLVRAMFIGNTDRLAHHHQYHPNQYQHQQHQQPPGLNPNDLDEENVLNDQMYHHHHKINRHTIEDGDDDGDDDDGENNHRHHHHLNEEYYTNLKNPLGSLMRYG
ncbi:unnamed protein product [Schistosoma turkestanicum]|nr:unnamed protein product [Schistosoma turkestanicum]